MAKLNAQEAHARVKHENTVSKVIYQGEHVFRFFWCAHKRAVFDPPAASRIASSGAVITQTTPLHQLRHLQRTRPFTALNTQPDAIMFRF